MSIDYQNDETYTLAYQVEHPEVIAAFAQTCAELALDELMQHGVNPRRKTVETIIGRAAREADGDMPFFQKHEPDVATPERCAFYRQTYIDAFLAHFRDEAVVAKIEKKHEGRGFIIVCYR